MSKELPPLRKGRADPRSLTRGDDRWTTAENSSLLGGGGGQLAALLSNLRENPYNERFFYDDEVIKQRAASLRDEGLIHSIIVCKHPDLDGCFIVVDGHYRWKAADYLSWQEIDIKIITIKSMSELYTLSRAANKERADSSCFDQAKSYKRLLDDLVYKNQALLAETLKVSEATVTKVLALNKLPPEPMRLLALTERVISLNMGYELSLLWQALLKSNSENPEEKFSSFCQKEVIEGERNRDFVSKYRVKLAEGDKKPIATTRKTFSQGITFQGKKTGSLSITGKNLKLTFDAETPEVAQRIASAIKELFEKEGG